MPEDITLRAVGAVVGVHDPTTVVVLLTAATIPTTTASATSTSTTTAIVVALPPRVGIVRIIEVTTFGGSSTGAKDGVNLGSKLRDAVLKVLESASEALTGN